MTATICATIANSAPRKKGAPPIKPDVFTPYQPGAGQRVSFKTMLKEMKKLSQLQQQAQDGDSNGRG